MIKVIKQRLKEVSPFGAYMYKHLGSKIFIIYFLSIIVGFLDSVGITIIIPLLQLVDSTSIKTETSSNQSIPIKILNFFNVPINLITILLFIISIFTVKAVIKFITTYLKGKFRAIFTRKIRTSIINKFIELNFKSYINSNTGRITNALTQEVLSVSGSFNFYNSAIISFFTVIAYCVFAISINPLFTISAAVSGLLITVIMRKNTVAIKKTSVGLSENNAEFNSLLIQIVHYYKYLKTTNSIGKLNHKIKEVVNKLEKLLTQFGTYLAFSNTVREPLVIFIICGIILFQVQVLKSSISTIFAALFIFYRALSEIATLQSNWQNFLTSFGAFNSLQGLEKDFIENKESHILNGNSEPIFNHSIKIEGLSFSYNDSRMIFENLNLEIEKNTTVALVGESGSGKSTLVDLISGLLTAEKGKILIDDINILDTNINQWRNKIGFISQDVVIFNDNVINNITLWDAETEENISKARTAAFNANALDFINELENQFYTPIGDRGIKLSGGQKQRLSISRELYKEVELLILDEATSALDSESEFNIKTNIDAMQGKITMIIIAHRLSTIKNADLILVFSKGKIIESGTFDQLISNKDSQFLKMTVAQKI
jgi:subfamily B ATP-binding cassette protein MsbA